MPLTRQKSNMLRCSLVKFVSGYLLIAALGLPWLIRAETEKAQEMPKYGNDSNPADSRASPTEINTLAGSSNLNQPSAAREYLIKPHFQSILFRRAPNERHQAHKHSMETLGSSRIVQVVAPAQQSHICQLSTDTRLDPILQYILQQLHLEEQATLGAIVQNAISEPQAQLQHTEGSRGKLCTVRRCLRCMKRKFPIELMNAHSGTAKHSANDIP